MGSHDVFSGDVNSGGALQLIFLFPLMFKRWGKPRHYLNFTSANIYQSNEKKMSPLYQENYCMGFSYLGYVLPGRTIFLCIGKIITIKFTCLGKVKY